MALTEHVGLRFAVALGVGLLIASGVKEQDHIGRQRVSAPLR